MCVGPRIRQYIDGCGIALPDISNRTGIPLTRLQSFLKGLRHMTFEEYELVCSVLGVGTDKFIFPRKPESILQTAGMTDRGQALDEAEEDL